MKEVKKLKYRLVYTYDSSMWCSVVLKNYWPRPRYYSGKYDVDGAHCYQHLDSSSYGADRTCVFAETE